MKPCEEKKNFALKIATKNAIKKRCLSPKKSSFKVIMKKMQNVLNYSYIFDNHFYTSEILNMHI